MKAKHLLFAMALPGLFAACSQEELANNEGNNAVELTKRHNAGVVEFTVGNSPETRFNHEAAKFNNGEEIDLYLMDELTGQSDNRDANHMHGLAESAQCWKYFNVWNELYTLKNYTQTRYPFAYNEEKEVWENCATLLEGNYFAMHPGNEKITNRKDVWRYINPVQGFSKDGEFYNKAMDNQFWLGYTPIYRDEDRTGKMRLDLSMQPILTVLKLHIGNKGNSDVIIDKIVFKGNKGQALPTIAYVKPANGVEWRKTEETEAPQDACGALECYQDLALDSKYSAEKTWPSTAKGRDMARSIVEYGTPGTHIPYGLEDTQIAYEYVFNFDENSELGGHFLKGNVDNGEFVTVYFPLPHNLGGVTLEPVIYGRLYNGANKTWDYGILREGDFTHKGNENKTFTLDEATLSKNQPYAQEVYATFDEEGFEALTEARCESTENLLRYIKGMEASYTTQDALTIEVNTYGNGLVINNEVVELIDNIWKENDCKITLDFHALNNAATPVILDYDNTAKGAVEDCMQYFNFGNGTIDLIVAKGNHVVKKAGQNMKSLTIEKGVVVDVAESCTIGEITNDGTLDVAARIGGANMGYVTMENHNVVNLKDGAMIVGDLHNEAVANVTGNAEVLFGEISNKNTCVNCGTSQAELIIAETGALSADKIINENIVTNNGVLNVTNFENIKSAKFTSNATSDLGVLNNSAIVDVTAGITTLSDVSSNEKTINIADDARVSVQEPGVLNNGEEGVINVKGDLMDNIKNSGYIYVQKDGHVIANGIVDGKAHGIIDITAANNTISSHQAKDRKSGKDGNYFRYDVKDEKTAEILDKSLRNRISKSNYEGDEPNPVIVRWTKETTATEFSGEDMYGSNIERVIISKDLNITGTTSFEHLNRECSAIDCKDDEHIWHKSLYIKDGATLTIGNNVTFTIPGSEAQYGYLCVWVDGKLKVNNWAKVLGDNVTVFGGGFVEIDGAEFTWKASGEWTGKWYE